MKWRRVKSRDVIDIRGASSKGGGRVGGGLGGRGRPIPLPGGLTGAGGGVGLIVVLVILAIQFLGDGEGGGFGLPEVFGPATQAPGVENPQGIPRGEDPQRDLKDFSTYVFVDAQRTWASIFRKDHARYDNAQLVLYSNQVSTEGCGAANSSVGPFYCRRTGASTSTSASTRTCAVSSAPPATSPGPT